MRHKTGCMILLVLVLIMSGPGATHGSSSSAFPDRESTYPREVSNITHEPWQPRRGEDVTVAVSLEPEHRQPERVSLLWCRVEPDYVCAYPLLMERSAPGSWYATIPGSFDGKMDVVKRDTVHVGYNLTLHYHATNATERVYAPLGNHWTPETFPPDTDGHYYFFAYGEATRAIPTALFPLLLTIGLALAFTAGLRRRTG